MSESATQPPETNHCQTTTLSSDRCVDRRLVHRESIAEVFLTDWCIEGSHVCLRAQLPRRHLMSDVRLKDFALLMEVTRQSSILAAHELCSVPQHSAFIFKSLDVHLAPEQGGNYARSGDLYVDLDVEPSRNSRGVVTEYKFAALLRSGMHEVMHGPGSTVITSARQWKILAIRRQQRRHEKMDAPTATVAHPSEVGRRDVSNVVISSITHRGNSFESTLIIDQGHPFHFDHPQDHAPGTLLFDACRQITTGGHLLLSTRPASVDSTDVTINFEDYCELDAPAQLIASCIASDPTRDQRIWSVSLHQDGRKCLEATTVTRRIS